MSKSLSLFLLLLVVSSAAICQKSFFGVDAGINVSNQRIYSITTYSNGTSGGVSFLSNAVKPTISIFYNQKISDPLSIRIYARYNSLGYKKVGSMGSDVDINYFTIPLTASYQVYKNLFVQAGSYVSFTLNNTKLFNQDITKTYHKNDWGFIVGAEHTIFKNFALNASYCIGIKNIWLNDSNSNPVFGITYSTKITNRALQVALIYKFKKPTNE